MKKLVFGVICCGMLFLGGCADSEEKNTDKGDHYEITPERMAFEFYQNEADRGNYKAQYKVGMCYFNGDLIEENKRIARIWFRKAIEGYRNAAEQGDVDAQFFLWDYYSHWNSQGEQEASKWLLKAAEQGHVEAQYNLGIYYFKEGKTQQEKEEAVKWYRKALDGYRKAAEEGDVKAQYFLAECCFYAIEHDNSKKVKWYRLGTDKRYFEAKYELALISQDKEEAVKWYRKAAEQGYVKAQYKLGFITQDKVEAVKWLLKAAKQGHKYSQYNLGKCYLNGDGISQDKVEAVKWLLKAAEQGVYEAKNDLENMFGYERFNERFIKIN